MGVRPCKYSDRHPGGDAPRRMIGDGMRVRQGFRALGATVLTGGAADRAASCSCLPAARRGVGEQCARA